eukprot:scaffold9424_cov132-Isochrysis_galbana.AAC.2
MPNLPAAVARRSRVRRPSAKLRRSCSTRHPHHTSSGKRPLSSCVYNHAAREGALEQRPRSSPMTPGPRAAS